VSDIPKPSPTAVSAWARLLRVSRQLTESAEEALKAAGLPPLAWYDALHEIAEAGEEGLRPFQLPERLLLAQYNVSRLLARLESEGLVEKCEVAGDGRGQTIRITRAGREMRRRMWSVYGPAIARLEDRLPADDLATLARLLGRLRDPPAE
jgi:DNA-binding MarR family transcriptional regulator